MLKSYAFIVADCPFEVKVPETFDFLGALPQFAPFAGDVEADKAFSFVVDDAQPSHASAGQLVESQDVNGFHTQLFRDEQGYRFLISASGRLLATLDVDLAFGHARATLPLDAPQAAMLLTNMLQITFAQVILPLGGIMMHASVVVCDGCAFLFTGRSGAGKSTHARQWLQAFPGAELLNDDNPVIRLMPQGVIAYGAPWSGKTSCYRQASAPVAAIVRIKQGAENSYQPYESDEAFASIISSGSSIRSAGDFFTLLCDNAAAMAPSVQAGILTCLPQPQAACLLNNQLSCNLLKTT